MILISDAGLRVRCIMTTDTNSSELQSSNDSHKLRLRPGPTSFMLY